MTTEDWVDALSIISDGLPSVTEGCRLPVRMGQKVEMDADSGKYLLHIQVNTKVAPLFGRITI